MNKERLKQLLVERLQIEVDTLTGAAQQAHAAATHEENQPRSKYETLALEASYIAQGQANRAQELRDALLRYELLELLTYSDATPIGVTALVTLEEASGRRRTLFVGPAAGGMRVELDGTEVVVVTPDAPLALAIEGLSTDDEFDFNGRAYTITWVQ